MRWVHKEEYMGTIGGKRAGSGRKPLSEGQDVVRVTIKMPEEYRTALTEVAEDHGQKMSYHIRKAIASYLEECGYDLDWHDRDVEGEDEED